MRKIREITKDIKKHWGRPYFGAKPYLEAMSSLGTIDQKYGSETAREIVERFLANASTFKGNEARDLKAELREILDASALIEKVEKKLAGEPRRPPESRGGIGGVGWS